MATQIASHESDESSPESVLSQEKRAVFILTRWWYWCKIAEGRVPTIISLYPPLLFESSQIVYSF